MISGFRLRHEPSKKSNLAMPGSHEKEAQDRIIARLRALGSKFDAMSEDEYCDWLNSLPQDEFFALMGLK